MKCNLKSKDSFDMEAIYAATSQLHSLAEELNELYPQRSFLINQYALTLLTRSHHLLYGTYGTGKSALICDILSALGVDNEHIWKMDFSRQTTESEVVGPTDVVALRNDGVLMRNPKGTIRQAKYAELNEFFDAPTLNRLLLTILHERQYRRGGEQEDVPLESAFVSTNVDPEQLIKRYPDSDALIDRFPFQYQITGWLESKDDMRKIYNKFRHGMKPTTVISYDEMSLARDMIADATDQLSDSVAEVMLDIVLAVRQKWEAEKWRRFSDRAFVQWIIIAEAAAVYNGHYEVTFEDLRWLKYAACNGSPEQLTAFESIVTPIIDKAIQDQTPTDIDEALMMALEAVKKDFIDIPKRPDDKDLVSARRNLVDMMEKVKQMKPVRPENNAQVRKFEGEVADKINVIDGYFTGKQM